MKLGLSAVLQFLCLFNAEMLRLGLAAMDDNNVFFKKIMLRQVMSDTSECEEEKLIDILAKLQTVSPESIINLAAVRNLDNLCSDLTVNMKEADEYLATCTPSKQTNLYFDLIRGVKTLDDKLCKDESFQQDFMKYAECFADLAEEFQQCKGPADWNEDPNEGQVCKTYEQIMQCYQAATAQPCGEAAASIMGQFIQSIINSVVTVTCSDIAENPNVPDILQEPPPAAPAANSSIISFLPIIIIIGIVIFGITIYGACKCLRANTEEKHVKNKRLK